MTRMMICPSLREERSDGSQSHQSSESCGCTSISTCVTFLSPMHVHNFIDLLVYIQSETAVSSFSFVVFTCVLCCMNQGYTYCAPNIHVHVRGMTGI